MMPLTASKILVEKKNSCETGHKPVPGAALLFSWFFSCASCAFHYLLISSTDLDYPSFLPC